MNIPTGFCRRQRPSGFTLVELLVVITIIGIILSFVLMAATDAARRAEERATQTLITKLETGMNDRLDALMQSRPDPNYAHAFMGMVVNGTYGPAPSPLPFTTAGAPNPQIRTTERAQVFAWFDYLKRELPDVFFIQSDPNYPINFAGQSFPSTSGSGYANYVLPLGNSVPAFSAGSSNTYGDGNWTNPTLGFTGAGIYGASYPIAAGLFKNMLNVQAPGYDGVDNTIPPNNLIDEIGEGQWDLAGFKATHTHATARAEMLYAILVEGAGPWGSVFNRDDFSDREVQDTDGDGLPEFVDAWGQPLQFFRWPVLYHSELQRGQVIMTDPVNTNTWNMLPPYQTFNSATAAVNAQGGSPFLERERDPLDPNQQLTAPNWWATKVLGQVAANDNSPFIGYSPAGSVNASGGVQIFEYFFHRLTEPIAAGSIGTAWDRGGNFARRAYYSKFLILSGGRDRQPGVFLYSDADMTQLGDSAAFYLIANENCALPFGLDVLGGGLKGFTNAVTIPLGSASSPYPSFGTTSSVDPTHPTTYDLQQAAKDDISNHNLSAGGAIGGSG